MKRFCCLAIHLVALSQQGFASDQRTGEHSENAAQAAQPEYSFAFLGDVHFDRLEHHDMDWVQENHPGDVRQIRNYSRITTQNTPALFEAMVHSLKNEDAPPFAIIQAGDFVEGLCGSYERQVQQFTDAIAFVRPYASSIPFLITKGNHDITGPGADKAYADIMVPWLGKQLNVDLRGTSYFVPHGDDLFLFFDGYRPDLDWLEDVLSRHPARHLFFILHQPVVPYNARSQWHIFSRPDQQHRREKLLSLLGQYHAIVLSGHLHHYSILRRKTEDGAFVQLALNSVVAMDEREAELLEGVDRYSPELVNREPGFSPDTLPVRAELLREEQPFITYFELADTPGYCLVRVSDSHVEVDVRVRSSRQTWRRLRIERSTLTISQR